MDDRLSQLESRVEELSRSLLRVEDRLSRLEEGETWVTASPASDEAPAAEPEEKDLGTGLALVGRTLLGLAGAYLLRALTGMEVLPQTVGVAAGLAYAALWILLADRAGGRAQALSAAFCGTTAVLVAVPLIWETTIRFAILSPAASAAALAALTGLALFTAWRRNLRSPAWIVSLGAGGSALMLGGSTHAPMPFALFLVLLGVATLWLARARSWKGLPWVTAGLADLAVLLLSIEDPIGKGQATLAGVVSIDLALFVLYAASFAVMAWRSQRQVTVLTALQTAAAMAVGYGGAASLLRPHAAAAFGAASLALAAGLYAFAFLRVDRRRKRSTLFFTTLAIPLVLTGSAWLLDRPAFLWALLALAGSGLGTRFGRLTSSLHAALYALAACVASGLLRQTAAGWTATPDQWPALSVDSLLALAATAACLAFPVVGDLDFWRRYAHLPRLTFLVLMAGASGALLVRLGASLLAEVDAGSLATVRTAVLAAASLALAVVGRLERLREAAILVYPVLIAGAFKLLIEDFPAGRPETLFLSLAFYGAALIVAPRLRRAGG